MIACSGVKHLKQHTRARSTRAARCYQHSQGKLCPRPQLSSAGLDHAKGHIKQEWKSTACEESQNSAKEHKLLPRRQSLGDRAVLPLDSVQRTGSASLATALATELPTLVGPEELLGQRGSSRREGTEQRQTLLLRSLVTGTAETGL